MELNYFIYLFVCLIYGTEAWTDNTQRKFKDDFLFGVSSASFQVEGSWNIDGKGESIWDRYLHSRSDNSGDDAADSYSNYKRDVEMIRELGADFYRFSISWARVLPTGFTNNINEKGLQYYDRLLDELEKYNIIPIVTIYHWDMPQTLQDLGGWANPLVIDWFIDYSKILIERYGNRVKHWITINQPNSVCFEGYGDSILAPGLNLKGLADYLCVKNVLLAHAKVYRMYEKEFKNKYNGSVGISISMNWIEAVDNKTENINAAQQYRDYLQQITFPSQKPQMFENYLLTYGADWERVERLSFFVPLVSSTLPSVEDDNHNTSDMKWGLYVDPIWSKTGDFPKSIKEIVAKKSEVQGFTKSRLPTLSAKEIKIIKGSSDFLGLNHYTTHLASYAPSDFDIDVRLTHRDTWPTSQSPWLRSVPYGLYRVCIYLNQMYDYPQILITENGVSTSRGLQDAARVKFLEGYLNALLLAIEDSTNVTGYTAWSLLDNVEWAAGTSERFGLYEVDFDSKDKKRTARLSALVYKNIINTRQIDEQYEPDDLNIKLSNRRIRTNKEEF